MKLRELIKKLQDMDMDMTVVRGDNSGGCEDIVEIRQEFVDSQFGETKGQTKQVIVIN